MAAILPVSKAVMLSMVKRVGLHVAKRSRLRAARPGSLTKIETLDMSKDVTVVAIATYHWFNYFTDYTLWCEVMPFLAALVHLIRRSYLRLYFAPNDACSLTRAPFC